MNNNLWADRLLRAGVAFAFLYPPINAWFVPDSWIGYFPGFILDQVVGHELLLLHSFGALEIILALWILSGKKIAIPSAIATIMLVGIVLFNSSGFEVVFRDLSIAAAGGALFLKHVKTSAATS